MKKLRKYLDDRGLRYGWFAKERLGMSPTFFSCILHGKAQMPIKYWRTIIEVTDGIMTLEDFFDYEES